MAFFSYITAAAVSFMAAGLLLFPSLALSAALTGMDIWWQTVFPSLLPFFIVTELLASLGVTAAIGSFFNPLFRFLFRLPGEAGIAWGLALSSGFPSGARLAVQLRTENKLSRVEAERLAASAHSSNPLFMMSAVAIGFFGRPDVGWLIAAAHYAGCLLTGITMRFYGQAGESIHHPEKPSPPFSSAESKRPPIGTLLSEAVVSSVQTLMLIGGFILFFSVVTALIEKSGLLSFLLHAVSIPSDHHVLAHAVMSGFIEIASGTQLAATAADLQTGLLAVTVLLAFSGFSVHAQVAALFSTSDLRYRPFFIARLLHCVYAAFAMWLLLKVPVPTAPFSLAAVKLNGPLITLTALFIAAALLFFQQKNSREAK